MRTPILPVTHTQRILDLARQKGMLRPGDLQEVGAARVVLTRLMASGQLEKVGRGLYRLPGAKASEHETLATIAAKVPQAVFCLLTALQFHGLTTQLPRQVWIAMAGSAGAPSVRWLCPVQPGPKLCRLSCRHSCLQARRAKPRP